MNLSKELLNELNKLNKTVQDIEWFSIQLRVGRHMDFETNQETFDLALDFNFDSSTHDERMFDYIIDQMEQIDYDEGYGRQYVFGHVVFKDGSWLERVSLDGAEEWQLVVKPTKTWY